MATPPMEVGNSNPKLNIVAMIGRPIPENMPLVIVLTSRFKYVLSNNGGITDNATLMISPSSVATWMM